jgi:hypothetical protein
MVMFSYMQVLCVTCAWCDYYIWECFVGDFTDIGKAEEVYRFNQHIGRLPHKHKIVIAGNHEVGFDQTQGDALSDTRTKERKELLAYGVTRPQDLLTNCVYLQDAHIKVRRQTCAPTEPVVV